MQSEKHICPSCGMKAASVFYEVKQVPVHSVLLLPTRAQALHYPKGDIALGFCESCGFISNAVFDATQHEYSSRYEETQGFSPTFNAFHKRLANDLIQRHDLHNKTVIEIGCGKGEFLALLCELGSNSGIGFDPAYVEERNHSPAKSRLHFVKDFYSEKYRHYRGDFVCCKMTLEHIHPVADFVRMMQRSISTQPHAAVFVQVPNVSHILRETAFWDIYYEHCSYFSPGALARLFRGAGFEVLYLDQEYGGQYLIMAARRSNGQAASPLPAEEPVEQLKQLVEHFVEKNSAAMERWRNKIPALAQSGHKVVIWGAGSKGVAFLNSLGIREEIEYAVDINPHKLGTYMAGTGQKIVGPDFLRHYKPDVVIAMNPVYRQEIRQHLQHMDLNPELMAV